MMRARWDLSAGLDEIVREGAMLAEALEAEVSAVIEALSDHVDETGHRLVRRTKAVLANEKPPPTTSKRSSMRTLLPKS